MKCWIARSHSGTHVRIQTEPFTFPWPGWDLREGTISQVDMKVLNESFGPDSEVERERIHQEAWFRSVRRGSPVAFGAEAVPDQPDLR